MKKEEIIKKRNMEQRGEEVKEQNKISVFIKGSKNSKQLVGLGKARLLKQKNCD